MKPILPPNPPGSHPWGSLQDRLHRQLLSRPQLLPQGARLLVAVSGGQDSMALVGLLLDLRRLHGWELQLWHGDHRWRVESSQQAEELALWAREQRLELRSDRAPSSVNSEASARSWRYECLAKWARALECPRVVTGHTASDRAETLVLHLARGAHLKGLSSLRRSRPLAEQEPDLLLVRPLLAISRAETAALCKEQELPIWPDPSNEGRRFARNRIRQEVLPVLEELHPGSVLRIAALAERLEQELDPLTELLPLALAALQAGGGPDRLPRQPLMALSPASRRHLLLCWLQQAGELSFSARSLEDLLNRLHTGPAPGSLDLNKGWRLDWDRLELRLHPPSSELGPAPWPAQIPDD